MKKLALLFLLIPALQCRKADLDLTSAKTVIEGTWELRKSVGGIAGTIEYPPGNGMVVKFLNDTQYSLIRNSTIFDSGTYLLIPTSTPGTWQLQFRSSFTNSITTTTTQINAETLVWLAPETCCDMATSIYYRI